MMEKREITNKKSKKKCCLCNKEIKNEIDTNNAWPLAKGECCGTCNGDVIFARLSKTKQA